jgi:hypothetical protein
VPIKTARNTLRILAVASAAAITTAMALPGAQAASGHARSADAAQPAPQGIKLIHPGHGFTSSARAANTLSLQTADKNGAVSPTPKVYLVFWGSQWKTDPAKVAPDLRAMFKGLYGSADTWGTILDQYCEGLPKGTTHCGTSGIHIQHPATTPLKGVWFDNAAAEPTNATTAQLAAEAVKAAKHFGNTTQTPNYNAQYVIVSPHGTHPDGFPNSGFCGWHDSTASSYGRIAYTNLPYVPDLGVGACTTLTDGRLLDGIESTETHEYAETVTDFFPTDGWYNTSGGEIGDECVNLDARVKLTTGSFDLQGLWSNSANKCVTHS